MRITSLFLTGIENHSTHPGATPYQLCSPHTLSLIDPLLPCCTLVLALFELFLHLNGAPFRNALSLLHLNGAPITYYLFIPFARVPLCYSSPLTPFLPTSVGFPNHRLPALLSC